MPLEKKILSEEKAQRNYVSLMLLKCVTKEKIYFGAHLEKWLKNGRVKFLNLIYRVSNARIFETCPG